MEGTVLEHWRSLDTEKLNWAFHGYDQFMQGLHPQTRACFSAHGEEAFIVLYGRTQVGKTTLLLQLLGIKAESQAHFARLLRAGQPSGHSSTATAMEYEVSPDDRWHLWLGNNHLERDEDGLVSELTRIRHQVEAGAFNQLDPVRIAVPQSYFADLSGISTRVRILDLPGDNPHNEAEAQHVKEVARRYVPDADLILLVGRTDDLTFLDPKSLELPGIKDWRFVPDRFRIITTFSFSLSTTIEWAKRQTELTVDAIRARLIEQIGTISRHLAPEVIYPLEFGESWTAFEQSELELHAKAAPCIQQLTDQLIQDITVAASPLGRLRQAHNTHIVVNRVKDSFLQTMEEEQAELDRRRLTMADRAGAVEAAIERTKRNLRLLPMPADISPVLAAARELFHSLKPVSPAEKVSAFKAAIDEAKEGITKAAFSIDWPEGNRPDARSRNPMEGREQLVVELVDEIFQPFKGRLNDYLVDDYWTGYRQDRILFLRTYSKAKRDVMALIETAWKEMSDKQQLERMKLQKLYRRRIQSQERTLIWIRKQENRLETIQAKKQADVLDFKAALDADLERARQYNTVMREAFQIELNERLRRLKAAASPVKRWLELAGSLLICDQQQKLLAESAG